MITKFNYAIRTEAVSLCEETAGFCYWKSEVCVCLLYRGCRTRLCEDDFGSHLRMILSDSQPCSTKRRQAGISRGISRLSLYMYELRSDIPLSYMKIHTFMAIQTLNIAFGLSVGLLLEIRSVAVFIISITSYSIVLASDDTS